MDSRSRPQKIAPAPWGCGAFARASAAAAGVDAGALFHLLVCFAPFAPGNIAPRPAFAVRRGEKRPWQTTAR